MLDRWRRAGRTDRESVPGGPKYSMEGWRRWKKKRNCKQMVEVQTRKRRNKIDSGRGRRERNNTLSGENLGRRPAGVKGEKKKCLHCCFYYLAAVILLYLWNEREGWTRDEEKDKDDWGGGKERRKRGRGKGRRREKKRKKKAKKKKKAVKLIFCA